MSPASGHRVVALVLDQVGLLDLAAPTHLFGYCGPPLYRFEMATCQPGRVRTSAGPDLHVEHGLGVLLTADTVIVPGYEDETAVIPPAALGALRAAAARGARVMSICTGAFALAEAGLLDGLTATTHWAAADLLASKYPKVTVQADKLYIDQGQILTSAGIAAGLDLCLHVIRRDQGAAIAAGIARRTVIAPHRDGGQAHSSTCPSPSPTGLRAAETLRSAGRGTGHVPGWPQAFPSLNWPLTRKCRPAPFCDGSEQRLAKPQPPGSRLSASPPPRPCSKAPACPSSRSRTAPAWAAPSRYVSTSAINCTPPPAPTAEPSTQTHASTSSRPGKPWEALLGGGCRLLDVGRAVGESGVPAVEVIGELVVEDAGADLE